MILIFLQKATDSQLKQIAEDFDNYVKFVVDVKKRILAAGGSRHVDAEELLLKKGSKQENLWGGGLDLMTNEVDFDSMINIRANQGNPSREVLSSVIREKVETIARQILG